MTKSEELVEQQFQTAHTISELLANSVYVPHVKTRWVSATVDKQKTDIQLR